MHAQVTYSQRTDPWILVYFLLSVLFTAISAIALALYESLATVFVNEFLTPIDAAIKSATGIAALTVPLVGLFIGLLFSYYFYSRYGRWSAEFAEKEEALIPRTWFTRYFLLLIIISIPYVALKVIDLLLSTTISLVISDLLLYFFGGFGFSSAAAFLWDYYDLHAIAREKGGTLLVYLTSDKPTPLTTTVVSPFAGHRFQLLDPRIKYIHVQILMRREATEPSHDIRRPEQPLPY